MNGEINTVYHYFISEEQSGERRGAYLLSFAEKGALIRGKGCNI